MAKTKIPFADKTWNPVIGCSPASAGCHNCYAIKTVKRQIALQEGQGRHDLALKYARVLTEDKDKWNGKFTVFLDRMEEPYTWPKKPIRVFVGSLTDIFHPGLTYAVKNNIFNVILDPKLSHIKWIIITKRAKQMLEFAKIRKTEIENNKNIACLVSCEIQETADRRIPDLLKSPFHIKGVSVEPMLEYIDIAKYFECESCLHPAAHWCCDPVLNWVVCGCESGKDKRPIDKEAIRNLRDQCIDADRPFFLKQMVVGKGKKTTETPFLDRKKWVQYPEGF